MTEYVSPLPVRIQRIEKKRQKIRARIKGVEKLRDNIEQALKDGAITKVERDIAALVHKKIERSLYKKGGELYHKLADLKREQNENSAS